MTSLISVAYNYSTRLVIRALKIVIRNLRTMTRTSLATPLRTQMSIPSANAPANIR